MLGVVTRVCVCVQAGDMVSLTLHCGKDYPDRPPKVTFAETPPRGITADRLPYLRSWRRDSTMKGLLRELASLLH